MDRFDHVTEFDVQFRDLDTNAHVNNAVYVSYLEQARAEYFADVIGVPLADAEIVLARLTIEYEAPIAFDETVTVYTRVPDLGTSSFPMENIIETDEGSAATAELTIVPFDLESDHARPIPQEWRDRIRAYEDLNAE